MMRRKRWFIAFAAVLVLVGADVAYWAFMAGRLRSGLQDWLAARGTEGWQVTSSPVSLGSWPYAASVSVPKLVFRHVGNGVPGAVAGQIDGLVLSISLFQPTDLQLLFTGPTHIQAGDLPDVALSGEDAVVTIPLRQGGPLFIDLHSRNLVAQAAAGGQVTMGLLNSQIAATGDADPSQPAARFALSAAAITLPAGMKWPLGPNISSISLDGRLNGPLPHARDVVPWAEAWRDGGGSLEITHLAMGWGPLGLTSSATLALDEQLQPMGSGNSRLIGYAETLDRLAAAGTLTKSAATAAKAVLSLMAGAADGDRPSTVDVPLTLQYRTLSMRQVPLVRLPELDWPAQ